MRQPVICRCAIPARHGFSLFELVVAVAVAVAAVAALLPAVQSARFAAVRAACLSNMSTLGVGEASYMQAYNQLPGVQYHEGTYWTRPWGSPYYYGGITAWEANGPNFWNDYLEGPNANKPSGYAGLGYVYPYVGGDGKSFYCPGTTASFAGPHGSSDPYIENQTAWYDTWTGIPDTGRNGFGQQGRATLTTYFYRSGMYNLQDLPDSDPRWAPGSPSWNWTRDTLVRPFDTAVQKKPMLTCFWYGYRDKGSANGWETLPPDLDTINHGGNKTNLLYTDGSTRTWTLPNGATGVSPVWGWFDAGAYTKADFHTGRPESGFDYSAPAGDFYRQMPWWWIEAQKANAP